MSSTKSNKFVVTTFVVFMVLGLLGAESLFAVDISVNAGGPYEGKVGEEIELDASASSLSDGSQIQGYHWDWDGDGVWDESFGTPEAQHTWYSAFSGKIRVYILYPGGVDWGDAWVTIEGPETAIAVTAGPSTALRLSAGGGPGIGLNEDTGLFDLGLAGATVTLVPPTNNLGELDNGASPSAWNTMYTVPLTNGPDYTATLTGSRAGPLELRVQGIQDGLAVSDQFLVGEIKKGETIQVDICVSFEDSNLQVEAGPLEYFPEMEVSPDDEIELAVQPGGRYSTTITISETGSLRPLQGVTLRSSELTGTVESIPISDIHFSPNGFNVAPGDKQEVTMTVEVPPFYFGQATGTVKIECVSGPSEEVDVLVRKAGTLAPVVEVAAPVYGVVGIPAVFDATGSYDPDGSIETYCWDWDLTGQHECTDGPVAEHAWNRAFNGVVHLRVIDDEGNSADQYVQVVITD